MKKVVIFLFITLLLRGMNVDLLEKKVVLEHLYNVKITSLLRNQLKINNFYVSSKVFLKKINSASSEILPGVVITDKTNNKKYQIDHIKIYVTLDKNVPKNVDELIKLAIKNSIEFNPTRGDLLKIERKNLVFKNSIIENLNKLLNAEKKFEENISNQIIQMYDKLKNNEALIKSFDERFNRQLEGLRKEFNNQINLLRKKLVSTEAKLANTNVKINNLEKMFNDFKENTDKKIENLTKKLDKVKNIKLNNDYYYWLIGVTIFLLILILIIYLILKYSIKGSHTELNAKIEALSQIIDKLDRKISQLNIQRDIEKISLLKENIKGKLEEIVLKDKADIKKFIKLNLNTEEGRKKIALIVKLLGYEKFASIFTLDDEKFYNEILSAIKDVEINEEDFEKKAEEIYNELIAVYEYKQKLDKNYFNYLENLTNEEILDLIKDEDILTKVIVISMLDEDRAVSIIDMLDENERIKVISNFDRVKKIPVQELKEISNKLFDKYKKYLNSKSVRVTREDKIIDVIRMFSPKKQIELLERIKNTDPNLYKQIRKKTYLFDDILNLDKDMLKRVISQFDVEELAVLFSDFDEKIKNKVISVLGNRKLAVLMDKLEENEYSEELKKEIRKKFLEKATAILNKINKK